MSSWASTVAGSSEIAAVTSGGISTTTAAISAAAILRAWPVTACICAASAVGIPPI